MSDFSDCVAIRPTMLSNIHSTPDALIMIKGKYLICLCMFYDYIHFHDFTVSPFFMYVKSSDYVSCVLPGQYAIHLMFTVSLVYLWALSSD